MRTTLTMSEPKLRRASQLSPEQREQQLLQCAIKAFADNGIGRANHAQVAKLAGVAVPTVFSYFPNRESLVDAVLEHIEATLLGIVSAEADNHDITAFQKLLTLLSDYIDSIDDNPDLVKVFLDWTTSYEDSLAAKFQTYLNKLVVILSAIIEEGRSKNEFGPDVNPVDASLMIYSSANVLAQIQFYNIDVDVRHYIINLIASVLHLKLDDEQLDDSAMHRNKLAFSQWSKSPQITPAPPAANPSARRSSASRWQAHINNWKNSGLTQSAYCKQHKLKPSTFSYWVKKQPSSNAV